MRTIKAIREALEKREITSFQLITELLETHEKYKDKNAIAQINPKAIDLAKIRDEERKNGHIRGILHGIPIAIKDNILYNDGTPTTCNSYAFHDFYAPYNATITKYLEDEGAIIMAKANLSEFAYFMSYDQMPSGYGSMYGQVKHPFDEAIDPYGSSTGSAVAVKLGIVPAAIGSETNGSLMAPAFQTQIVAFKPSFGLVSKHGIIPISHTQDTAGPMALSVYDCAILMDVIAKKDSYDEDTLETNVQGGFEEALKEEPKLGRIGLLKIKDHDYDSNEAEVFQKSKMHLENLGYEVLEITIVYPELDNDPTLTHEFKYGINEFLKSVRGFTRHKSLRDIIDFNLKHSSRCLKYGQSILEAAEKKSGQLDDQTYQENRMKLIASASLLEHLIIESDLIAIAAPLWMGFAPIYGNPSVCIPEGIYNGIPKSMVFVGKKYEDKQLLKFAHHYQESL